jgi:hypothetical protein
MLSVRMKVGGTGSRSRLVVSCGVSGVETRKAAAQTPLRMLELTTHSESPWIHMDGQGTAMYAEDF